MDYWASPVDGESRAEIGKKSLGETGQSVRGQRRDSREAAAVNNCLGKIMIRALGYRGIGTMMVMMRMSDEDLSLGRWRVAR